MLVRDVLAALVQHDPARILVESSDRALEYDPVARRIVRRLLRTEVTSLNVCVTVVNEEIEGVLACDRVPEATEATASAIWGRWEEILVYDRMLARWRES